MVSLATRIKARQIAANEFEHSAEKAQRATLSSIKETIGRDLFDKIFGEIADPPEAIFDPDL